MLSLPLLVFRRERPTEHPLELSLGDELGHGRNVNGAFHPEIWVIRKIDEAKKTALATPVLPPINGPTPTVEGPMAGPESPFKKATIPS